MVLCVFTIAPVTSSRCIRLHLCLCCRSFVEYSASFSWSVGVLCASRLLIWDHPCGCSHCQMAPHLALCLCARFIAAGLGAVLPPLWNGTLHFLSFAASSGWLPHPTLHYDQQQFGSLSTLFPPMPTSAQSSCAGDSSPSAFGRSPVASGCLPATAVCRVAPWLGRDNRGSAEVASEMQHHTMVRAARRARRAGSTGSVRRVADPFRQALQLHF
ncbi:hypothetical protein B0H11DRAFT_2427614 [Mycena galericulata]|nr:hypothetical protein B0H11DRAFT_2427614 [Mycena galericulata]